MSPVGKRSSADAGTVGIVARQCRHRCCPHPGRCHHPIMITRPAVPVAYARRSRSEFVTTMTLEHAIAAPAIIGLRSPAAASGIAATL